MRGVIGQDPACFVAAVIAAVLLVQEARSAYDAAIGVYKEPARTGQMDARRKRKRIQRVRTVMLLLICIVQIIVMRQNGLDQIGIVCPILRHIQQ